jgi:hypothetical protein
MMSVAAGWKLISQGFGWAAWAEALASIAATAPAPARNFLIAFIISPATWPQEYRIAPERESRLIQLRFKPYSFPCRKKGAGKTMRHFARARPVRRSRRAKAAAADDAEFRRPDRIAAAFGRN